MNNIANYYGSTEPKILSSEDSRYADKHEVLMEYASKPEIEEAIDKITDSVLIYAGNKFCYEETKNVSYSLQLNLFFNKIYHYLNFHDGITAWERVKYFLAEGYLAFEIIYDEKQNNIIGFQELLTI